MRDCTAPPVAGKRNWSRNGTQLGSLASNMVSWFSQRITVG